MNKQAIMATGTTNIATVIAHHDVSCRAETAEKKDGDAAMNTQATMTT
ncbi:MAG: hypothetical protein J4N98_02790 [Chloroflexi bacterium]|nr:hypothetical protein [Chloroflexota bacterium]